MGMKSVDIAVNNQTTINVTLATDDEVLDEVVVVGYGRQKKESVVGAISTVDVANLKMPGSSISNVLAGQLAGVVAMTRSGEPGKNSAADFYIRGVNQIFAPIKGSPVASLTTPVTVILFFCETAGKETGPETAFLFTTTWLPFI